MPGVGATVVISSDLASILQTDLRSRMTRTTKAALKRANIQYVNSQRFRVKRTTIARAENNHS